MVDISMETDGMIINSQFRYVVYNDVRFPSWSVERSVLIWRFVTLVILS